MIGNIEQQLDHIYYTLFSGAQRCAEPCSSHGNGRNYAEQKPFS
jgi:hypothetical protein